MRILFIADGRSPIALNWMGYFTRQGFEIHLASSYRCEPQLDLASIHFLPTAFSRMAGASSTRHAGDGEGLIKRIFPTGARTRIRQWVVPLSLPRAARALNRIIEAIQPELLHALRIPYESMLTALAEPHIPFITSVWGNDFTLHAPANPLTRHYTRKVVRRTDALMADCRRDIRLAYRWGFPAKRHSIVLPGGGGIKAELFFSPEEPVSTPVVVNPRGLRAYVRSDTFFHAIPRVLAQRPGVHFLCPAMSGEAQAERWVAELGIEKDVTLLPRMDQKSLGDAFRKSMLVVSPSEHDGSPNSLLEAMACGCFPVAGDIESLREWIRDGENGLLVDPADPDALAAAILKALEDDELRTRAHTQNLQIIGERAEYSAVMAQAEAFYRRIVD
ncbi:MAG: glycosyltransferase family 4 protein [Anaerolineales bacterium]|jgi:glycosyltransferase involved in cell wall biosynthesis